MNMKKRSFLSVFLCLLLLFSSLSIGVSADTDDSLYPIFTDFQSLKDVVDVCSDFASSGRYVYATYSSNEPLVITEDIVIPDYFYIAIDDEDNTMIINEDVNFEITGTHSTIRTNSLTVNGTMSVNYLSVAEQLTVNGTLYNFNYIDLNGFDVDAYEHINVAVSGTENIIPVNENCVVYDYRYVKNTSDIKKAIDYANNNQIYNWCYYITLFDYDLTINESLTFPANTIFETSYWDPKTITIEENCMVALDGCLWYSCMPIINKGIIYNSNGLFSLIQDDMPTMDSTDWLSDASLSNVDNGYFLDNGVTYILSPRCTSPFDALTGVDASMYTIEESGTLSSRGNYWYLTHNCHHEISDFDTTVIAPDCNDKGYTTYTCEKCGESFKYNFTPATGVHTYDNKNDAYCNSCDFVRGLNVPSVPMYRMYDPNSGEHFYTGSTDERDFLVNAGWHYEGVGFNFPVAGRPVHRLYEPITGEHLYTMDEAEKAKLIEEGWKYEGVAFNSGGDDEVAQYRLHNPNSTRGAYHFTGSEEERDILINAGWEYQGIGWYSCKR
ncbi:MAG: hypothetical protein J6M16_10590 [Clostridia bacterium]|nr:hypothetical protein [Clostridia bacterium]